MKTQRFQKIEDLCTAVLKLETPSIQEVDNGVGPYEYWGYKGVDVQLDGELEELEDVKFELFVPKGTFLTGVEFSDFIAENLVELDDAVCTAQVEAQKKAALTAEEYGKQDYSDIIKLEYQIAVLTYPNSVEVFKLAFTFSWVDGRY
ncbi:MAG: hypothetical protein RBQ99_07860 [Trichlorobacter sp.]|nr:hypothetical protein [Trichlorobacter sp.]